VEGIAMTFIRAALMVVRLGAVAIVAQDVFGVISEKEALGAFAGAASAFNGGAIVQVFFVGASCVSTCYLFGVCLLRPSYWRLECITCSHWVTASIPVNIGASKVYALNMIIIPLRHET
jgi:hypothetical protein